MADQKSITDMQESALNASQVLFTANPVFLAPQARQVLQMQEQFFAELEQFSTRWFKRRQEAVHLMIESGRRIATEGRNDPAGAIRELAEWQTGAMQRLAEDAREYSEMLVHCARAAAPGAEAPPTPQAAAREAGGTGDRPKPRPPRESSAP